MSTNPIFFACAYPGGMSRRESGDYVEREDSASLAAALLRNIQALRNQVEDLESVVIERDKLKAANAELAAALEEVCRVFESKSSGITDTVWVTGTSPETLYDHCRAALANHKSTLAASQPQGDKT